MAGLDMPPAPEGGHLELTRYMVDDTVLSIPGGMNRKRLRCHPAAYKMKSSMFSKAAQFGDRVPEVSNTAKRLFVLSLLASPVGGKMRD